MTELKKSNCDKTRIETKHKLWQNSNCDKSQVMTKLKLWEGKQHKNLKFDKTQVVMKLNNSNDDKTQKLKMWQNSKTHIVTKLENSNYDKTQKFKFWHLDN